MINPEEIRLKNKLKLWETPGFSQFIKDLIEYSGPLHSVENNVNIIKRSYQIRLREIEENKGRFKQGKLEL